MYQRPEHGEQIVLRAAVVARWCAFDSSRRELPGLDLSFGDFCKHLDQLGYSVTLPKHPGAVHLCAACAGGNHAALKILESRYFPALRRRVLGLARRACLADDVLQRVRERLFVGPSPRIAKYRGQGALPGWLSVIASNALRDELRTRRQERAQHALLEVTLQQEAELEPYGMEERALAGGYAGQLELLLIRAARGLSREDRHFLRLRYVDGFSIDEVARLHTHHRSTAARKIRDGERRLEALLRRLIASQFGTLEAADFIARVTTLQQQLPLRVSDLFAENGRPLPVS